MNIENYLKYNLSPFERSEMSQFRLGISSLNIVTGWFGNQILDERLCTLCEFNAIEHESHFLIQCRLYDELRSQWVSHILYTAPNLAGRYKIDKCIVIFYIHHRITVIIFTLLSATKTPSIQNIYIWWVMCTLPVFIHDHNTLLLWKRFCSIHVLALYVNKTTCYYYYIS